MKIKHSLKHALIFITFLLITLFLPFPVLSHISTTATVHAASEQNKIKLNVRNKTLVTGTKYKLKVYNYKADQTISFKSSAPSIVSVNKKGLVKGKKVGNATITVTVKSGYRTVETLECSIKVGPPAVSVKFTKNVTLSVGEKLALNPVIKPKNTAEVPRYSSSDTDIVTVSSSGKITAVAPGSVYIFAEIGKGDKYQYDYCIVTVVK